MYIPTEVEHDPDNWIDLHKRSQEIVSMFSTFMDVMEGLDYPSGENMTATELLQHPVVIQRNIAWRNLQDLIYRHLVEVQEKAKEK